VKVLSPAELQIADTEPPARGEHLAFVSHVIGVTQFESEVPNDCKTTVGLVAVYEGTFPCPVNKTFVQRVVAPAVSETHVPRVKMCCDVPLDVTQLGSEYMFDVTVTVVPEVLITTFVDPVAEFVSRSVQVPVAVYPMVTSGVFLQAASVDDSV